MLQNYRKLHTGAIKQIVVEPFKYDIDYVKKTYDDSYGIQCDMMSYLRYAYIVGATSGKPSSILDVGYGNGSFLKICQNAGVETFGTDISHYPLPYGKLLDFKECQEKFFDVITFFDSLEHFDDISFLKNLKCNYVCISLPNCSYNAIQQVDGEEHADIYFQNWKHRKPNEHIWHYDIKALDKTMEGFGFSLINFEYIEDAIRKSSSPFPNILTAIFQK
jgi:SAM-dependent methyltransferase